MRRFFPGATSFKSWSWVRAENILSVLSKTTRHELIATFTDNCWDVILKLLSSYFSSPLTCGGDAVRFIPTLISQSATVEQRNEDANYRQNGQHSDNDHAVTALYIRIEIANLPPDLLVRKALFVRRFFMLNMFPHVESPRRPDEWTRRSRVASSATGEWLPSVFLQVNNESTKGQANEGSAPQVCRLHHYAQIVRPLFSAPTWTRPRKGCCT